VIERQGDIWDGRTVVITTNGFVKTNGQCVMGRGCAKEATQRYPRIAYTLGQAIKRYGNRVIYLGKQLDGKHLISFPVKPDKVINNGNNVVRHMAAKFRLGDTVPGWAARADIDIIRKSTIELRMMIDKFGITEVYMPRPGCGAGELDWRREVKPILEPILDDRFIVCHK